MNKVLITGASSGVGKSIAFLLYKQGYELILLSRRTSYVDELFENKEFVHAYSVDLAKTTDLEKTMKVIVDTHGYIGSAVFCAARLSKGEIGTFSKEEFDNDIALNFFSITSIIDILLPLMKKNNFGRIVNLTSGAPLNCFPGYSRYSVTKAMLNTWTYTLAKELEENFNIRVNLMSPGPVRSEMAPNAVLEPVVCHPTLLYLLASPPVNREFCLYWLVYKIPITPDLTSVNWLEGYASEAFKYDVV